MSAIQKTLLNNNYHRLLKYIIEMADIGFGLTREDTMQIAYRIVEKTTTNDGDGRYGRGGQSLVDLLRGEPHCVMADTARKVAKKRPSEKCPTATKPPARKQTKVADISVDG